MKKIRKLPMGLRAAKLGMEKADPSLEFRVGAAWLYKSKIVISWNSQVTSPAVLYHGYKYPDQNHAEFRLFSFTSQSQPVKVKGTVYVYRELADHSLALAKPCVACLAYLKWVGVTRIVYSTYGGWIKEKL